MTPDRQYVVDRRPASIPSASWRPPLKPGRRFVANFRVAETVNGLGSRIAGRIVRATKPRTPKGHMIWVCARDMGMRATSRV